MVLDNGCASKVALPILCLVLVFYVSCFHLTGKLPAFLSLAHSETINGTRYTNMIHKTDRIRIHGNTSVNDPVVSEYGNGSCTFGLFRRYFKSHGYIPSGGDWTTSTGVLRYQPNLCKYKYKLHKDQRMSRCLTKANVTHVVTTGDSNGGFNFEALVKLLTPPDCRKGRNDGGGFHPNAEYYTHYDKSLEQFIRTGNRFCASACASKEWFCQRDVNSSQEILVEQIATTQTIDDSIQLYIPETLYYGDHMNQKWALTTQEFVLRYFLKNRYPNFMVITLPFNHDKNINLSRLRIDIEQFMSLIEFYVPRTTKIFYIPTFSEFEEPRKTKKKYFNKKFDGVLAAEKIRLMNHLLYEILEEDISDPDGRTYGFVDLWEMSRSRGSWNKDGVHMQPVWYQNTMAMFWETYCNSVFEDDF